MVSLACDASKFQRPEPAQKSEEIKLHGFLFQSFPISHVIVIVVYAGQVMH